MKGEDVSQIIRLNTFGPYQSNTTFIFVLNVLFGQHVSTRY